MRKTGRMKGGGGQATTSGLVSGHVTFYNQAKNTSSESLPLSRGQVLQRQWEETLCVQIRQLPIYSINGHAMPLNRFASPEKQKRAPPTRQELVYYKSMNTTKLKETLHNMEVRRDSHESVENYRRPISSMR